MKRKHKTQTATPTPAPREIEINAGGPYWSPAKELLAAPHLLIAGTTGSGKSILLHDITGALLALYAPTRARLILIDPKRVELVRYKNAPHTLRYVTESADVLSALKYAGGEMLRRYDSMRGRATLYDGRDIYVIIDELADLMISPERREIQKMLQKILQLGRAAKIHVIAATQAPNRRVIPAELVLNFTDRIALRCINSIESRQIINRNGAELLPQYGKGIYLTTGGTFRTLDIPKIPDEIIDGAIKFYTEKCKISEDIK